MSKRPFIVAVDGPAGSGKSSICGHVAHALEWSYINTGAIYRAVGAVARKNGTDLLDEGALITLIRSFGKDLVWDGEKQTLFYKNEDISPLLHTVQSGADASYIAKNAKIRDELLPLQRQLVMGAKNGALVDGRDIGTVVFPEADLKIYMTASLEERARRRLEQIMAAEKTQDTSIETLRSVMDAISSRDEQDAGRGVAPMRQADDAVLLDTSGFDIPGAVQEMLKLIKAHGLTK